MGFNSGFKGLIPEHAFITRISAVHFNVSLRQMPLPACNTEDYIEQNHNSYFSVTNSLQPDQYIRVIYITNSAPYYIPTTVHPVAWNVGGSSLLRNVRYSPDTTSAATGGRSGSLGKSEDGVAAGPASVVTWPLAAVPIWPATTQLVSSRYTVRPSATQSTSLKTFQVDNIKDT